MKRPLALALVLFLAVASLSSFAAEPRFFNIALSWTQAPESTQTVAWKTGPEIVDGVAEFAEASGEISFPSNASTVKASSTPFSTNEGEFMIHAATFSGLKPGAKYVYRVGDGRSWSEPASFSVVPSDLRKFKFLVFSDSQSGDRKVPDYKPWGATLRAAFAANPDARLFFVTGDLVEAGQDYAHWRNWFANSEGVIERLPFMPVEGNHETFSRAKDGGKPVYFIAQFATPENGPEGLKRQVYSFDLGDVHFVVLDSQADEEFESSGDILPRQVEWLDKDLAASSKTWKIALFHKPPYYNKAVRANEDLKAAFCPILEKHHVDAVFNGHDHGVSRTFPMAGGSSVKEPSKGVVYFGAGRSGQKTYHDLAPKLWNASFYDPQDQPCYLVVNVDGRRLSVNAFKQDGSLIDSCSIDK